MLSIFLNGVIRFALHNRMLVAALATILLLYGGWQTIQLPIDVFPDLNRPRVVIMTEAQGYAPEEVESLISFPIETALNGASGVQDVRSTSGVGLSVIYVEFEWGTDIYNDRQIVAERLALAAEQMPEDVRPQLAPISSIMGQILMVGMLSEPNDRTRLFDVPKVFEGDEALRQLDQGDIPDVLVSAFEEYGRPLSHDLDIRLELRGKKWAIGDRKTNHWYAVVWESKDGGRLVVHRRTSPLEMRTIADWVIRQQMLTVPGVSQVFVMGGDRKQFQVLVDPDRMLKYGVTVHDVEAALARSNDNATGGYLDEQGPHEYLVRALGRVKTIQDLEQVVVKYRGGKSVTLAQVARVVEGAQVKRGDSSVYLARDVLQSDDVSEASTPTAEFMDASPRQFVGGPGIVLTIAKQPGGDTRAITKKLEDLVEKLQPRLPDDIVLNANIYKQQVFIDHAIENVIEALRDGGILVVIILFLFLLNFRTTFITLTAIPLSIVVTALVFWLFGLSINTMTLGGLAVAIGELVDDAIVDVENIFRRLKENRQREKRKPSLLVVFQASVEIRNSIVFGTMIVVLVFLPLFALGGMEGRLFAPLGVAYIVSILASLLVSLTVTPVLSYWLLGRSDKATGGHHDRDGWLLRVLKYLAGLAIRTSLRLSMPILAVALALVAVAGAVLYQTERDFLPPFNEGAVQINVLMPPGTSLAKSREIAEIAGARIREVPEVMTMARRTGRAELDEHAENVNVTEFITSLAESHRSREEILDDIRGRLANIPGIVVGVEQPLAHLISHMLSGVKAQVGIKLYGDDLDVLRRTARQFEAAIQQIPGVTDVMVEQQTEIPQLIIQVDGQRLEQFGLTRRDVTEFVQTAMNGVVVSEILDGQRKFDLLVRLDEPYREDLITVGRLQLNLPDGGRAKLEDVAAIREGSGPNQIKREKVRRRIVVQCNVSGRGLVDVVEDIRRTLQPIEEALPTGYFIEYGGQFQSQQSASRMLAVLFVVSIMGIILVLYTMFRSFNLAFQVIVALPMAFIGSVTALALTEQTLTIAAMVGFISLCGIATRNGILLINHYLHLVQHEGEGWTQKMIVRAGQERMAPVLMTCLTTGIGLVPLALAAGETGKEILYPVATVIIGGLITSTALEFLVRPVLFWKFGLDAAKRVVQASDEQVELVDVAKEHAH